MVDEFKNFMIPLFFQPFTVLFDTVSDKNSQQSVFSSTHVLHFGNKKKRKK